MSQNIVNILLTSPIFPAVEFSLIISLVIVTYWGMHMGGFSHVKPVTRMSVSMLLGSVGYIAGKMVVVSLFASKVATTAYAF